MEVTKAEECITDGASLGSWVGGVEVIRMVGGIRLGEGVGRMVNKGDDCFALVVMVVVEWGNGWGQRNASDVGEPTPGR